MNAWRADFPALAQAVRGEPLVYLDSAATTQKPFAVIEALDHYYRFDNANVHRGVHALSERATAAYEGARDRIAAFINAQSRRELVFVRGTTEAINLVAQAYLRPQLQPGDEILVSQLEHHSNIVPWQLVAARTGATVRMLPMNDAGELVLDDLDALLSEKTRLLAVGHVSNALGTVNPVARIVAAAKARGVPVLVDGAQALPHTPVDVQALGCDFYAFSGHKMFGPTGIGCLWARESLLDAMPPWQGGGDMIRTVRFTGSEWNELPYKFEAGTPNIAGAIGLGAAVDYLGAIGMDAVAAYEADLLAYATDALTTVPGLKFIGTAKHKAAVLSFVLDGIHPHDIGTIVDAEGVAIRTGHHCAMPVMEFFGVPATARASLALYNTHDDVNALVAALARVHAVFA
ncbi:MAG: cysteine desulfurase [Gammaproteobacteria bacterium]